MTQIIPRHNELDNKNNKFELLVLPSSSPFTGSGS